MNHNVDILQCRLPIQLAAQISDNLIIDSFDRYRYRSSRRSDDVMTLLLQPRYQC